MEIEVESKTIFSDDCQFFAILTSDNRLKIYEVETKKHYEYKDDKSTSFFTACAFGKSLTEDLAVLAFGNNNGEIKIYDFKKKTILNTFKEHNDSISHIKFTEDNNFLLSSSSDKKIIRWDLSIGKPTFSYDLDKKGALTPIYFDLLNDDLSLIFNIDNKLNILDTGTQKVTKRLKGHTNAISYISSIPKSNYFVTCADEDCINIWSSESETTLHNISINSTKYKYYDCKKKGKSTILILACNPTQLSFWIIDLNSEDSLNQNGHHIIVSDNEISNAFFYSKESLLLALGSNKPEFLVLNLYDENNGTKQLKDVSILTQEISSLISQNSEKINSAKKSNDKRSVQSKDYYIVGETELTTNDIKSSKHKSKYNNLGGEDSLLSHLKDESGNTINLNLEAGQMDSLAVVLLQALHNDDVQLLEYCLERDDDEVIENTVKKILQSKLLILLDKIIARLNSYHKKSSNLLIWLKYILKYHISYLIKVPGISERLGPLISMFKKRTENIDTIYKLKGKLDMLLLLEDDNKREKSKKKTKTQYTPHAIYEEGDIIQVSEQKEVSTKIPSITRAKKNDAKMKEEKEFSDSISESDEDINDNFDQYLNANQDIEESEDFGKSDEEDYIEVE